MTEGNGQIVARLAERWVVSEEVGTEMGPRELLALISHYELKTLYSY